MARNARNERQGRRECGECRACCVVLGFEARAGEAPFAKPAGEPCPHLIQIGCAIYDERPAVCRRFQCGWIQADNLPDELRPDRCGVLFCTNDNVYGDGYAVYAYELRPGAADGDLPRWLIGELLRELPVILVRDGEVEVHPARGSRRRPGGR